MLHRTRASQGQHTLRMTHATLALYDDNGFSGCLCCIKGSLKTVLTSIRADEQAALFYRRENHH